MKGIASSPSLSMMWGAVAGGVGGWRNGVCSKILTQVYLSGCPGQWWEPGGHSTGGVGEMVPAACSCTPINWAPIPWWPPRCWCSVLGAWAAMGGLSSNLLFTNSSFTLQRAVLPATQMWTLKSSSGSAWQIMMLYYSDDNFVISHL